MAEIPSGRMLKSPLCSDDDNVTDDILMNFCEQQEQFEEEKANEENVLHNTKVQDEDDEEESVLYNVTEADEEGNVLGLSERDDKDGEETVVKSLFRSEKDEYDNNMDIDYYLAMLVEDDEFDYPQDFDPYIHWLPWEQEESEVVLVADTPPSSFVAIVEEDVSCDDVVVIAETPPSTPATSYYEICDDDDELVDVLDDMSLRQLFAEWD